MRREVHHVGDSEVPERCADKFLIGDVSHHQPGAEYGISIAEFERVEHDDIAARRPKRTHGVRTDVAGTTSDQHCAEIVP